MFQTLRPFHLSREQALFKKKARPSLTEVELYYFCPFRTSVVYLGAGLFWRAWSYPGQGARPSISGLEAEQARGDLWRPGCVVRRDAAG